MASLRDYITIVETLLEYRVVNDVEGVTVYTSPTAIDVGRLVMGLGQIRGYVRGGQIYLWNAEDATHWTMGDKMHISSNGRDDFDLYLSSSRYADEEIWEKRMKPCPAGFFWAAQPEAAAMKNNRFRQLLGYKEI